MLKCVGHAEGRDSRMQKLRAAVYLESCVLTEPQIAKGDCKLITAHWHSGVGWKNFALCLVLVRAINL